MGDLNGKEGAGIRLLQEAGTASIGRPCEGVGEGWSRREGKGEEEGGRGKKGGASTYRPSDMRRSTTASVSCPVAHRSLGLEYVTSALPAWNPPCPA